MTISRLRIDVLKDNPNICFYEFVANIVAFVLSDRAF